MKNIAPSIILGLLIGSGFGGGGYWVGKSIVDSRKSGREVSVKGLAEREVMADFAKWSIGLRVLGDDLTVMTASLKTQETRLRAYLTAHGFGADDITTGFLNVNDLRNYGNNPGPAERYEIQLTISVASSETEKITNGAAHLSDLIQDGVHINNSFVNYLFRGLNKIKPELTKESTTAAQKTAEQFAVYAGRRLGELKSVAQGSASIVVPGQDYDDSSSPRKLVRVVSSATYYLID